MFARHQAMSADLQRQVQSTEYFIHSISGSHSVSSNTENKPMKKHEKTVDKNMIRVHTTVQHAKSVLTAVSWH